LATAADNQVKLREVSSSQRRATLRGQSSRIRTVVWEPRRGQEMIALQDHHTPVNSVAFSPDGQTLIAALVNGPVRIWRTAN
jgi:WD40 repeat protein